ncbi:MAG: hypothetical protein II839_01400, partial [Kiritimatiellae bacterium]|nr:hypothetical protein [Kiritimatiellia bacterium]
AEFAESKSHAEFAESAESKSHAEFAESAESKSHAEFAESAESKSHAEFAESAESKSHAEFAESAESKSHAEFAESAEFSNLDLGFVDNCEQLGFVNISFAESRPWAGCSIQYPDPVSAPDSASRADLEFLLTAPDLRPLPPLQIRIGKNGGYVPLDSFVRETGLPGTWRVSFPLDLAADGLRAPFREFSLQLQDKRPEGSASAVSVWGVRILADGGPEESPFALRRLRAKGLHGVETIRRDGGIELAVDDKAEDWGYAWLSPLRHVALPEDPATAVLAFDVNGGRTPLGRRDTGRQRFRVQLTCPIPDKKEADGPWVRDPPVEDGQVDDDPNSWQTVRIPLAKLLPEGATAIARITLQYTGLPSTGRAGLLVRDFRFEPAPGKR